MIIGKAKEMKAVTITGLHFHIGSQILDMGDFKALCNRINDIQALMDRWHVKIPNINVGGGLGIDYEHPNTNPIPDFKAYFDTYAKRLKLRPAQTLHFELGRAVVAQMGSLITRTLYIKKGAAKQFCIVDAGMTDLIRPALYQAYHKIENISSEAPLEAYDVVGPICESTDVFAKQIDLNRTQRGDLLAIRSAGFTSKKLVNSVMAIDFAYAVYLLLQETKEIPVDEIKSLVQRWYVLSVLTGRYSASPETAFAKDIRAIGENGVKATLKSIEDATLSDAFWNVQLNQNLTFVSSINPTYQVFLAAQNFFKKDSLLSHIPVGELVNLGGDIHHIFPKQYLVDNGYDKHEYNQVANYAYLDTPINIKVGKKAPKVYLNEALNAIRSIEDTSFKSIKSEAEFYKNLEDNCIPVDILDMDHTDYQAFLEARRIKMTELIKSYYYSL
jgi:uncharacterized protein YerC